MRGREGRRTNKRKKSSFLFLVENIPFSEEKHKLHTGPKAHNLKRCHEHQLRKASVNAKFYLCGPHAIESPDSWVTVSSASQVEDTSLTPGPCRGWR